MSTLDNLRKEAKRWLKALREDNPEARERLFRAYPEAPAEPGLRDLQHALALERGAESWKALTDSLAQPVTATTPQVNADLVATFLACACWDDHVHGRGQHGMNESAAMRLLMRHPGIARHDLYTAVVCGEREEVERILAERPGAARELGGPRGWPPLLYLCYSRVPTAQVRDNAVAIATTLLDLGADPNSFFQAFQAQYSASVGLAGEGEQDAVRHPCAEELYCLLLERGAGPYDIQVLYNTHFRGDVLWWLEPTFEQAVKLDRKADWDDPEWPMFDMGAYGSGARFLLWVAGRKNDLRTAEWLLSHGANPNSAPARDPRFSKRSLYEDALRQGFNELAELLLRSGATPVQLVLQDHEAYASACFRLDEAEARAHLEKHPEYLRSPYALFAAAKRDRADVVKFLLDLGTPIEISDAQRQRALHKAAGSGALAVARLLIEHGAEVDPRESNWDATPLGYATHEQQREMIELLSRHSRDVWNLSSNGKVERLREVLSAEPGLATTVSGNGSTPLWRLPDDESKALEIIELFLSHGADPALTAKDGTTAADQAAKRGLDAATKRLAAAPAPELRRYERLAADLSAACESGDAAALQRVNEHFRRSFSADELSALARQRLTEIGEPAGAGDAIELPRARLLIARASGFSDWTQLEKAFAGELPLNQAFASNPKENSARLRRALAPKEWDSVISVIKERQIAGLDAAGRMTDALMERVSTLDHLTRLDLGGCEGLTDTGLRLLARLPRLERLDLAGCDITDAGLEVLRELPNLRWLQLCHQGSISDKGATHLENCSRIEHINLMNTPTGNGAIRALAGKPRLAHVMTGNEVTEAGVELLHELPVFKTWQGGEVHMELMSPDARPSFLWLFLKSRFLNPGLTRLAGLDGLFGLSLHGGTEHGPFSRKSSPVTPADLSQLEGLRNLGWLGVAGDLCDDEAMRRIGTLPRLRMLMGQGAVAGDEGFSGLSRSSTIEYIWGRECPNLTGRGFQALARMPALRGLAVSCANVDDDALSSLPRFPSLRDLMPMDVTDDGFRHVGQCRLLEGLWCMYCRETTDAATEHIANLSHLKTYYAGKTRITDRSLEILSKMPSLESVSFWACAGITDAGLALLAGLPHLREVSLQGGMPRITLEGTAVFPAHVHVDYST